MSQEYLYKIRNGLYISKNEEKKTKETKEIKYFLAFLILLSIATVLFSAFYDWTLSFTIAYSLLNICYQCFIK